ncbi:MAG: hypothetical protein R3286_10050 [Gammaproteobacteria bacterium]|nr:hypothetical protein [Gammaproteobacteria bacterium]
MSKASQESTAAGTRAKGDAATSAPPRAAGQNQGAAPGNGAQQQPRIVSRPEDVAGLVLMQIDMVNARKDDLTIAIKGLSDLTRQLVRAYGENAQTIQQLQQRVKKLEGGKPSSADGSSSGSQGSSKRK